LGGSRKIGSEENTMMIDRDFESEEEEPLALFLSQ
jgi:hypothetical protein